MDFRIEVRWLDAIGLALQLSLTIVSVITTLILVTVSSSALPRTRAARPLKAGANSLDQ